MVYRAVWAGRECAVKTVVDPSASDSVVEGKATTCSHSRRKVHAGGTVMSASWHLCRIATSQRDNLKPAQRRLLPARVPQRAARDVRSEAPQHCRCAGSVPQAAQSLDRAQLSTRSLRAGRASSHRPPALPCRALHDVRFFLHAVRFCKMIRPLPPVGDGTLRSLRASPSARAARLF